MTTPRFRVTEEITKKLLKVVDAGLSDGVGDPTPGAMCVEAAVCYTLGQPHGDKPKCVLAAIREVKIALNDLDWTDEMARSRGLRRVAVAQLGSKGKVKTRDFGRILRLVTLQELLPWTIRKIIKATGKKYAVDLLPLLRDLECNMDYRTLKKVVNKLTDWTLDRNWSVHPLRKCGDVEEIVSAFHDLVDVKPQFSVGSCITTFTYYSQCDDSSFSKLGNRRLRKCADIIETTLIECGSPGADFLYLCER